VAFLQRGVMLWQGMRSLRGSAERSRRGGEVTERPALKALGFTSCSLLKLCDAPLRVYKGRILSATIHRCALRRLPVLSRGRLHRRRWSRRIPASCRVQWRHRQTRRFENPRSRALPRETCTPPSVSTATDGNLVLNGVSSCARAVYASMRFVAGVCARTVRWLYGGESDEVIQFMMPMSSLAGIPQVPMADVASAAALSFSPACSTADLIKQPLPNTLTLDEIQALNILALPFVALRYGPSTTLVPPAALIHGMALCNARSPPPALLPPPPRFSNSQALAGSQLAAARNYARTQWLAKWYAHNNSDNTLQTCCDDIHRQFLAAKKAYSRHNKEPMADVASAASSSASFSHCSAVPMAHVATDAASSASPCPT